MNGERGWFIDQWRGETIMRGGTITRGETMKMRKTPGNECHLVTKQRGKKCNNASKNLTGQTDSV